MVCFRITLIITCFVYIYFMKILIYILISVQLIGLISCEKQEQGLNTGGVVTEALKVGAGPEDETLDDFDGRNRILVSCSQRREGMAAFGEIVAYDPASKETYILARINEPAGMPFHPHGFYIQRVGDDVLLYVINHYQDELKTNAVAVYKVGERALTFVREYKNSLMISPNDLCVLPDGAFYFSNDMGSGDLIYEQLVNKYGGSVVYCSASGECKMVDEKLAFPNGLESRNGYLYLATTRHKAMFKYAIQADGSLTDKTKINSLNGMDNLTWYGDELLVSVHPDEIAFVAHSVNQKAKSPSAVYAIHAGTGKSRLIFEDNGKRISGGSTALILDNHLYIAQVFEDFLLKVDL